jgi:predicted RNase H-like HicB family nuclease
MRRTIQGFIERGERLYLAECASLGVSTQGLTIDEAVRNLQEAVTLCLEQEDPRALGLDDDPTLLVTMELRLVAPAELLRRVTSGGAVARA